ncbi:MAG: hypothetical protein HC933_20370 [Pleurocapsa sp. SU_196_0]|nr:hypothetical protein [Pleurocapsa sp. SU_196_0]
MSRLSPSQLLSLARQPSPGGNELPGSFKCSAELDTNAAFDVTLEAMGEVTIDGGRRGSVVEIVGRKRALLAAEQSVRSARVPRGSRGCA